MTSARCLLRIGSRFLVSHLGTHTSQLPTVQPGVRKKCRNTYRKTTQDHKRHEMGSQRLPKWSQKLPKALKRHPRAPQRLPKGAQVGPRGSQGGPKGVYREPKGGPKGSPGRPKCSPRDPRGAPAERSWNPLVEGPLKSRQNVAKWVPKPLRPKRKTSNTLGFSTGRP